MLTWSSAPADRSELAVELAFEFALVFEFAHGFESEFAHEFASAPGHTSATASTSAVDSTTAGATPHRHRHRRSTAATPTVVLQSATTADNVAQSWFKPDVALRCRVLALVFSLEA